MIAVLTAPGKDQEADDHHEGVQQQPGQRRADDVHRQAADQIVGVVLHADFVGNQQHGQEGDAGRQHQAVDEDDERRLLEIRQLRRFDLAIDLGQRLLAAHGQDRMAEGDQQADHADDAPPAARLAELCGQATGNSRLMKPSGSSCWPVASLIFGFGAQAAVAVGLHFGHELAGVGVALPHLLLLRRSRDLTPCTASYSTFGREVGRHAARC